MDWADPTGDFLRFPIYIKNHLAFIEKYLHITLKVYSLYILLLIYYSLSQPYISNHEVSNMCRRDFSPFLESLG